jgi:hypothetical protein
MVGRRFLIASIAIAPALTTIFVVYVWAIPGLSSARPEPPAFEAAIATWLLHQSVPEEAKRRKNPVRSNPRRYYCGTRSVQACELCHAYDGSGKTQIGSGEYGALRRFARRSR